MVKIRGKKFTVILREEQEDGYSAQCVELPGLISEGENREKALNTMKEDIVGFLEAFQRSLTSLNWKGNLWRSLSEKLSFVFMR